MRDVVMVDHVTMMVMMDHVTMVMMDHVAMMMMMDHVMMMDDVLMLDRVSIGSGCGKNRTENAERHGAGNDDLLQHSRSPGMFDA